jgi:uncharacterized protein YjbI with pentapeptide repeats
MKGPSLPSDLKEVHIEALQPIDSYLGLRITDTAIHDAVAAGVSFEGCKLDEIEISSSKLRKSSFQDVICSKCLLFGSDFDSSGWLRVKFNSGTASGVIVSGSSLRDVMFVNVKLNLANFRASKLIDVQFKDCDLSEADFQGAYMKNVSFSGCDLAGVEFSKCEMKAVDLRGSDISSIKGAASLKGAKLNSVQLIGITSLLASEIGIEIED